MERIIHETTECFAAANGFGGFRSYFDEILEIEKLNHLYILKGGPGTGKSTLMRKIQGFARADGFKTVAIRCSSDTESLDGVIIDGKVAIIDGTAPHEYNARLPGARDEIINLGEFWDDRILYKRREEIKKINKTKKEEYISAYEYLAIYGIFFDLSLKIAMTIYDNQHADRLISDMVSATQKVGKEKTMILSAFGKDGYFSIKSFPYHASRHLEIKNDFGIGYIFIDHLRQSLKKANRDFIRFVSPYSEELSEAIYITDPGIYVSFSESGSKNTDVTDLCLGGAREISELTILASEQEKFRELARSHFKAASNSHFELEKIYKAAMNFAEYDALSKKIYEKIKFFCQSFDSLY